MSLPLHGVKLRHLRIVLAVHESDSITQAASRLHVSPAAVSKALAEAEEVFGEPLFERGRGWVRLTPLGDAVLACARTVAAEMQGLGDAIEGLKGGYRGEVSLGVKAISVHPFVADAITEFSRLYPQVRVNLVEGSASHLRELLDSGRIQLLFARLSSDIVQSRLAKVAILSDEVVIVASAAHPLVDQISVNWKELVQQRWCLPSPGTLMRDHLEQILAARRLRLPAQYVETSDMAMVAPLFELGPYVTIVPRRVAQRYLGMPAGAVLPIKVPATRDAIGMIWNEAIPMRPTARLFRDLAQRRIKATPGHSPTRT